jgi:Sulfotransferase family
VPALTDGADAQQAEYRYPDFLCVGAQKAGTSWLDRNLRRHPALWLPPMKELQYFNHIHMPSNRKWTTRQRRERGTQMLRNYTEKRSPEEWDLRRIARLADISAGPVSDDWYGRIFSLAEPKQLCGEVTPDYCTLPDEGIRHVLRLSPEVRIMLSLRDPIERSWSHIRMIAEARGMSEAAEMETMAANIDQVRRADYPAMIANWRRFIPQDRLHILFMDDIASDPTSVLKSVCGFLGVKFREKKFAKSTNAIHVGKPREIPPRVLALLKTRLRPIYDRLGEIYPEIAARWAARHY